MPQGRPAGLGPVVPQLRSPRRGCPRGPTRATRSVRLGPWPRLTITNSTSTLRCTVTATSAALGLRLSKRPTADTRATARPARPPRPTSRGAPGLSRDVDLGRSQGAAPRRSVKGQGERQERAAHQPRARPGPRPQGQHRRQRVEQERQRAATKGQPPAMAHADGQQPRPEAQHAEGDPQDEPKDQGTDGAPGHGALSATPTARPRDRCRAALRSTQGVGGPIRPPGRDTSPAAPASDVATARS